VATLEPHTDRTISLRRAASWPQVVGTSRHVVQGSVDLVEERWDAATRTLHGRSTALDGRAYTVTIAVPSSLGEAATDCRADLPCTLRATPAGGLALVWPAGSDGRDLTWTVRFAP
jgi:hypothetical protein